MRETNHIVHLSSSVTMECLPDSSVQLVVTSPPYPMIAMWDKPFSQHNPEIGRAMEEEHSDLAFQLMHQMLDEVWMECFRVLKPGGIMCVNIGDAVRKLGGHFRMYSNHTRVLAGLQQIGFQVLPSILWRKPTNAPNKFMGSGMLPGGAYVTLEHEHILVLRKGGNRIFETEEAKVNRRESAFFWEERNTWFSDIWDVAGARQSWTSTGDPNTSKEIRGRSAAYPLEIPVRLISMYSVYGDTVIDPFWGTGTTTQAAAALGRNSMGWEIDRGVAEFGVAQTLATIPQLPVIQEKRLESHRQFIMNRAGGGKIFKYINSWSGLPVITGQERELVLYGVTQGELTDAGPNHREITLSHSPIEIPKEYSLNVLRNHGKADPLLVKTGSDKP